MTKENFKEFVKEHEHEFKVAATCLSLVGKGLLLYAGFKAFGSLSRVNKSWTEASAGAKLYLPAYGEDIANWLGDNAYVRDANGDLMKITGALLFGNFVEE